GDFHVTGVQTCALPIFEHDVVQALREVLEALVHEHVLVRAAPLGPQLRNRRREPRELLADGRIEVAIGPTMVPAQGHRGRPLLDRRAVTLLEPGLDLLIELVDETPREPSMRRADLGVRAFEVHPPQPTVAGEPRASVAEL